MHLANALDNHYCNANLVGITIFRPKFVIVNQLV